MHGATLLAEADELKNRYYQRTTVLGIDPENVLVIELNGKVSVDDLERADLHVLSVRSDRAIVAFAGDADLTTFVTRCAEYEKGATGDKKSAPYQAFFDRVERLRAFTAADVVDPDLAEEVAARQPGDLLRVDIGCWCPDSPTETRRRFNETLAALTAAGGVKIDASCRYPVGLSLIRADLPARAVWDLAEVDRICRISLLPRPLLTVPEVVRASADDLPMVMSPRPEAPIAAVVDSGVRAGHPLLAPAIADTIPVAGLLSDGADECGHGTMVASLVLHGSLEEPLHSKQPLRPAGWVLGLRVLDGDNKFPDDRVWEEHVAESIRLAVQRGARVVNLSLGDELHPYQPSGPIPVAAVVDELVREHDLVVVISAGNIHHENYPEGDPGIVDSYPLWLLEREDAGLLPPAMSALSLTVGALVPGGGQGARQVKESVDVRLIGRPGQISPLTRLGPGIENMIKPELTAPGGTYVYDLGTDRVRPDKGAGMVVGASAGPADRLLAQGQGTSFAAPLVTHAALRVLGRYPALSANAVRALLLASAETVDVPIDSKSPAGREWARRRLAGYGRVLADYAEFSADHRAVLLAESEMRVDEVHFYTVPVPAAFFQHGRKRLTVALAFDPEIRPTRLDYLASHMSVFAYRGISVDEVRTKYDGGAADEGPPPSLDRSKIPLQPADQDRLHGANQYATMEYTNRWDDTHKRHDLVIVVRNTRRWAPEGTPQRYAVAVVLETAEALHPLYGELRARLPALAEIEDQIDLV